ncbi:hypothetical protein A3B51_00595 [Candidatus Curtissbacteria bacterium RIFCSPLOWO2_01_FULL_41_18]|uniref:Methyltransferase type 11 domain-containing protein n=1 Tax=Candidatus Curtissbacteria bacterium RIFCSPLOWO2_01_FULL_41_18 TaxID=1797727 RepID=A0A1F5HHW3_9BACT|nr:MAG: hypothetical protein A3B51_00595 [Candidatus Curtissbacteria bacterium RIFCSPLOWO2_01_FULL_41_18]
MKIFKKTAVLLLKYLNFGSAIAVRLTKLTGKSKVPVHPKHFLNLYPWYSKYLDKKDVILDLGCGNGQASLKVAKIVRKVFAVDIDRNLLKIAQIEANYRRLKNIKLDIANLEKPLKFKDNYFDKVIFLDVLEHLKERAQILCEIKRVVKNGGLMFLGAPNNNTSWKKLQRSVGLCSYSDSDHKVEFSEQSIKKLLASHNFKIIHFGYGKYDTPLRGVFDIIGGFSLKFYKKISDWRQSKAIKNPKEASGFEIVAQNIK